MAAPAEKMAQSLENLRKLQNEQGIAVVKTGDLSRTHKERLIKNGFLREVIKGWYISTAPEISAGDTTSWYTSFWYFVSVYFHSRFGDDWCLSPEQSLSLHSGNFAVPRQLLVRSPKASNNSIALLYGTSFFDLKLEIPEKSSLVTLQNLQVYSLTDGLIACGSDFFARNPTDARTCLSLVRDPSPLLAKLLNGGRSVIAGRLAGAFRNIGNSNIADEIITTMKRAGYDVREDDPFTGKFDVPIFYRETSPYSNRIKLMWHHMRSETLDTFPRTAGRIVDPDQYLEKVEEQYFDDAYNSLSIEGYKVTAELIERVRDGNWNPETVAGDRKELDAMAARGYYQAFQEVKQSIRAIIQGNNAGNVVRNDHRTWYRELFAPYVIAGLLKPADLAGYRSDQVYIKNSMHTPLRPDAVYDAMETLFDLLEEEKDPRVRAVLGHFVLVYVHPYMDGNGRIGRFLFNAMLASGGYPWTVIPLNQRSEYMAALEKASVDQEITDFAVFLGKLVKNQVLKD